MSAAGPDAGGRPHYAWVIAAVTFVILLVTAGIRATPGLFMVPLEHEFGWSRAVISASVAVNIALFGLIGPFAASVMDRWGLRRVVLAALALLAASIAVSTLMQTEWQLLLLWGVLVGSGTGVTAMVLAAVVATRWFDERRGVVLGALSAANATGQLVFLPLLAGVVEGRGWRAAALVVAAAAAIVFAVVWLFMRDRPGDLGLRPYGQAPGAAPQRAGAAVSWPSGLSSSSGSPSMDDRRDSRRVRRAGGVRRRSHREMQCRDGGRPCTANRRLRSGGAAARTRRFRRRARDHVDVASRLTHAGFGVVA